MTNIKVSNQIYQNDTLTRTGVLKLGVIANQHNLIKHECYVTQTERAECLAHTSLVSLGKR